MRIDPARLFKSDTPRFTIVLDGEFRDDIQAHARYQASERFTPGDMDRLDPRHASDDPLVKPRWPFKRLVTLSWLVLSHGPDGYRPLRIESRGLPEQDEAGILKALFNDVGALKDVELVTWGGFYADLPRMLMGAMDAGLRLPPNMVRLLSPWQRERSGHRDLAAEIAGGAGPTHLNEVAARLGIPVKTVCRPDLVFRLMEQGKWSSVRGVAEGDTLATAMILMLWQTMAGDGVSRFEAINRLCCFVAQHCSHRPYCSDWIAFRDRELTRALDEAADRVAVLCASS